MGPMRGFGVLRVVPLGALVAGVLAVGFPAPPLAAGGAARCRGVPATQVGTDGADVIDGTSDPDVIAGLGGDDLVRGLGGNDLLCGGDGDDRLFGGDGDDRIFAGPARDILVGDEGANDLDGGEGPDACFRGRSARSCGPVVAAAGDIACSPARDAFRGGAGTDTQCRMAATSDLMVGTNVSAVLVLGDAQYEKGEIENFRASYHPTWGRLLDKTLAVPGNHDLRNDGEGFYEYFGPRAGRAGEGYHDVRIRDWHLIGLNSGCPSAGGCGEDSPQGLWLLERLSAERAPCTLAYWHAPRFSSGRHGDTEAVAPFFEILHRHGADLVLTGHDHNYERFAPMRPDGTVASDGIRQFVVGTGGKNLRDFKAGRPGSERASASAFGVLELALLPGEYVWLFVSTPDSDFTDLGTGTCHNAEEASGSDQTAASPSPSPEPSPRRTTEEPPDPSPAGGGGALASIIGLVIVGAVAVLFLWRRAAGEG